MTTHTMNTYSIATDYEYTETHKRERLSIWSGAFASDYEGEAYSRPRGWTIRPYYGLGDVIRVDGPNRRTDENYPEVDRLISDALEAYWAERAVL